MRFRLVPVLVSIGALLLASGCGQATIGLIERQVAAAAASDFVTENPDGVHVVLCGAGSPLPDPKRSGPCVAVIAKDRVFVVDAGSAASRNLNALRIPQGRVTAVLLTHFHSDHIDGLGELLMQRWVNANATSPLPIHGPEGVEQIVDGLRTAYTQDSAYRTAHHGADIVPPSGSGGVARPFPHPADGHGEVVYDEAGIKITAFRVDHEPVSPAVGYRFDVGAHSVVVSGDTAKSANLEMFANDADVLVHEALSATLVEAMARGAESAGRAPLVKILNDILDYHTTPVEAAESAQTAGARHLLFHHIVPPLLVSPMEGIFLEGVSDAYDGPVTLGEDGTWIHIAEDGTIATDNLR